MWHVQFGKWLRVLCCNVICPPARWNVCRACGFEPHVYFRCVCVANESWLLLDWSYRVYLYMYVRLRVIWPESGCVFRETRPMGTSFITILRGHHGEWHKHTKQLGVNTRARAPEAAAAFLQAFESNWWYACRLCPVLRLQTIYGWVAEWIEYKGFDVLMGCWSNCFASSKKGITLNALQNSQVST